MKFTIEFYSAFRIKICSERLILYDKVLDDFFWKLSYIRNIFDLHIVFSEGLTTRTITGPTTD